MHPETFATVSAAPFYDPDTDHTYCRADVVRLELDLFDTELVSSNNPMSRAFDMLDHPDHITVNRIQNASVQHGTQHTSVQHSAQNAMQQLTSTDQAQLFNALIHINATTAHHTPGFNEKWRSAQTMEWLKSHINAATIGRVLIENDDEKHLNNPTVLRNKTRTNSYALGLMEELGWLEGIHINHADTYVQFSSHQLDVIANEAAVCLAHVLSPNSHYTQFIQLGRVGFTPIYVVDAPSGADCPDKNYARMNIEAVNLLGIFD